MIRIKKAHVNDIESIQTIAEKTWWPAYENILLAEQIKYMLQIIYAYDTLKDQIEHAKQTYMLLLEENKPKAFASYAEDELEANCVKIHKLYCLPETQGKGYGTRLIEEISKIAIKSQAKFLKLNVNRSNRAFNFYKKQGFTIVEEVDIAIGDYWMNDYIMRKAL